MYDSAVQTCVHRKPPRTCAKRWSHVLACTLLTRHINTMLRTWDALFLQPFAHTRAACVPTLHTTQPLRQHATCVHRLHSSIMMVLLLVVHVVCYVVVRSLVTAEEG